MGYESEDNKNIVQLQEAREGQKRAIDNAKADIKRMSESYDVKQKALIPDIETKKMRGYLKDQLPPDVVLDAYGTIVEEHITENSPKWIKEAYNSVDDDMKKVQEELNKYIQEESEYDDSNSGVFLDRGAAPSEADKQKAEENEYSRSTLNFAINSLKNISVLINNVDKELRKTSFDEACAELNKKSAYYKLQAAGEAIDFLKTLLIRPLFEPIEGYDDITVQELIDSEKEYLSTDQGIYHRKYNKENSNDLSLYLNEVESNITEDDMKNKENFTTSDKKIRTEINIEYEYRNFNKWSEPRGVNRGLNNG